MFHLCFVTEKSPRNSSLWLRSLITPVMAINVSTYMKQVVYTQHFCNLCILFAFFNTFILKNVMCGSCSQAVSKPVWHIPLLCVQWKTPDDGHRNCLKHEEFHSKNKFEKLVHLVGFIIRNLSRCTVTWTSKKKKERCT